MSKEGQANYFRTKELLKKREFPILPQDIQLKDGSTLSMVTPYAVVEGSLEKGGEKTLRLFYLDSDRKAHKVDVKNIEGLNVIEGSGEYAGKLLLEFTYFKPSGDSNVREQRTRAVLVGDLYHGVHPNHEAFNETSDFYIRGEDSQYADKPVADRDRNFPFWRLSVYGEAEQMMDSFSGAK